MTDWSWLQLVVRPTSGATFGLPDVIRWMTRARSTTVTNDLNNERDLDALGFNPFFRVQFDLLESPNLVPARIAADGQNTYSLLGAGPRFAHLSGKLRHSLASTQRPVAGDWVALEEEGGLIHHILERRTVLKRRSASRDAAAHVIAANVDVFFVVTSANRDLNPRRLERQVAAVLDGGANPVVVVNKTDLVDDTGPLLQRVEDVARAAPVVCTSAHSGAGLEVLREFIRDGVTVGFIGSSGVGKSSLVNRLLDDALLATGEIRSDGKGRHTTTRRELSVLRGGGLLLDTPGLRELGLVEDDGGIDAAFPEISSLVGDCRYRDCRHEGEPGCAVERAVATGALAADRYESYCRLRLEAAAAEARRDPGQAQNAKRRWKGVSKAVREFEKISRKRRR